MQPLRTSVAEPVEAPGPRSRPFDKLRDRFDKLRDRFDKLRGRSDDLRDRFDKLRDRSDKLRGGVRRAVSR